MERSAISRLLAGTIWAMPEDQVLALADLSLLNLDAAAIEAAIDKRPPNRSTGGTAVIPIIGSITQRSDIWSFLFGGTSTQAISQVFRAALADDRVKSIVFEVDSPGGGVYGVQELANEIYQARGQKPITAVANSLAASAAFWIASAADEFTVTPSGQVGSIGVFGIHEDWSAALEQMGIKPTIVRAGKYKAEGTPYEPLSPEARDYMQQQVDDYYSMFVDAVARNRGTTAAKVKSDFGEGRVMNAREAVKAGMVDRMATLDDVLQRHGGMDMASSMARSEESPDVIAARSTRLFDIERISKYAQPAPAGASS